MLGYSKGLPKEDIKVMNFLSFLEVDYLFQVIVNLWAESSFLQANKSISDSNVTLEYDLRDAKEIIS